MYMCMTVYVHNSFIREIIYSKPCHCFLSLSLSLPPDNQDQVISKSSICIYKILNICFCETVLGDISCSAHTVLLFQSWDYVFKTDVMALSLTHRTPKIRLCKMPYIYVILNICFCDNILCGAHIASFIRQIKYLQNNNAMAFSLSLSLPPDTQE